MLFSLFSPAFALTCAPDDAPCNEANAIATAVNAQAAATVIADAGVPTRLQTATLATRLAAIHASAEAAGCTINGTVATLFEGRMFDGSWDRGGAAGTVGGTFQPRARTLAGTFVGDATGDLGPWSRLELYGQSRIATGWGDDAFAAGHTIRRSGQAGVGYALIGTCPGDLAAALVPWWGALGAFVDTPPPATGLDIVLHPGPDLLAHPQSTSILAALDAATAAWEARLDDPITVELDVGFTTAAFSSPFEPVMAAPVTGEVGYAELRAALNDDASANEGLIGQLPAGGALSFDLAPGISLAQDLGEPLFRITSANARALGLTGVPQGSSVHSPGASIDGTILFNSGFSGYPYDFDASDGIDPGAADFTGHAMREIGRMLGFASATDQVDALVGFQPLRFDGGPAGSPVEPGFLQLTHATAYSPAQGYGWASISTGSSVDTGLGASDLYRDYVLTPEAELWVDLPNGVYDVTVTFADLTGATHDLMGVFTQGAFIGFTGIGGASPNVRTLTTIGGPQVVVSDGRLVVGLRDLNADLTDSPIAAIEITQNPGNLGTVTPTVADLFRLAPNQAFATAPRLLQPGVNEPIQVFHDGVFDVSGLNGSVDLNEDTTIDASDLLSTGDVPLSTGVLVGDGGSAGAYKASTVTGPALGVFAVDPRLGEEFAITPTDERVLGLVGYDVD